MMVYIENMEQIQQQNRAKEIEIKAIETMKDLEKTKYDTEKQVAEIEKIKLILLKYFLK